MADDVDAALNDLESDKPIGEDAALKTQLWAEDAINRLEKAKGELPKQSHERIDQLIDGIYNILDKLNNIQYEGKSKPDSEEGGDNPVIQNVNAKPEEGGAKEDKPSGEKSQLDKSKWNESEHEAWDNMLSKGKGFVVAKKSDRGKYKNLIDEGLVYLDSFGSGDTGTLRLTEKGEKAVKVTSDNQKPTESGSGVGGDVEKETGTLALMESGFSLDEAKQFVQELKDGKHNPNSISNKLQKVSQSTIQMVNKLTPEKLANTLEQAIKEKENQAPEKVQTPLEKAQADHNATEDFIQTLKDRRDGEEIKYKNAKVTNADGTISTKKVLKTPEELKASKDKINEAINKAQAELEQHKKTIEELGGKAVEQSETPPTEEDVDGGVKAIGNYNPKFKAAKKIIGEETTIEMPNGETREAEYMVVESDDILASHNEISFNDTEGFPKTKDGRNANSRNYKEDSAKLKVKNDARNLKSSIVISDQATTDGGVPIISEDGIVVSGNGRTMAIKLSQNIAPEKYEAYKADLLKRAAKFGIDPNEVAKMKKPILVKVDKNVKDYSVKTFDEYNGKYQKEESPIDKAIKRSSIIQNDVELKERILSIIGRHETMSDLFENRADRKELFDVLVANDIILRQETPKYVEKNGEFTGDGKDLINDILIATILSPETLEATNNVKAFRNKIINALPVLSVNYKLGNNSLEAEVNDAIMLQSRIAAMGLQDDFWKHLRQMGMFDAVNPNTVIINRMINNGAKDFKKFVVSYNKSMEIDENNLFGGDVVLTKQQIIDNLKESNLNENEKQIIANLEELYAANEQKGPIGNGEVGGGNEAQDDKGEADKPFVQKPNQRVKGSTYVHTATDSKGHDLYIAKDMNTTYPYMVIDRGSNNMIQDLRNNSEFPEFNKYGHDGNRPNFSHPPAPPREKRKIERKIRDAKDQKDIDGAWDDLFKPTGPKLTMGGIDPDKLAKAMIVVGKYMKRGIHKFADIIEDAYATYGSMIADYFDAVKAAYLTYRKEQATDAEAAQMDANISGVTFDDIIYPIDEKNNPKDNFINEIAKKLSDGEKLNIVSIRAIAMANGLTDVQDTELQEYVEAAIIINAKNIVAKDISEDEKFGQIVKAYEAQPTISMRSSERIDKQQYSTPTPMSFLAGEYVNSVSPQRVLEPSAGNGMMLINVAPKTVVANEIDPVRVSNLEDSGYAMVTSQDAILPFKIPNIDGVIMNPPFGPSPAKEYGDGYSITGLDEQMVINALDAMSDHGRAAIIIGGHTTYASNGSLSGNDRAFLNYLYNYYNVADVINMAGDLYYKQGTSYPTRMILINGRRTDTSTRMFAPTAENAKTEQVNNFNELQERVKKSTNESIPQKGVSGIDINPGGQNPNGDNQGNGDAQGERPGSEGQGGGAKPGSTGGGRHGNSGGKRNRPPRTDGTQRPDSGTDVEDEGQPSGTEQLGGDVDIQRDVVLPNDNGAAKPNGDADITEEKVQYEPQSKGPAIGSVIPRNMAWPLANVLHQFGDIDTYTQLKLGYSSVEELHNALAAEQIDGVALAIYQIEHGGALIIGDQTGVGKGRQAAAIIRYAVLNGKKPIFVTEKPQLFSDLYRDLVAIGSGGLNPLIINDKSNSSDPTITDEDGNVIYKSPQPGVKKSILASMQIPKNYDYAVITYSQLSAGEGKVSRKKDYFSAVAYDNIVVMDESHNAGGQGNTNAYLLNILPTTKGVVFLSGTFAKRPENIPIYSTKTAMRDANMTQQELIDAIKYGGVPLQEIMSRNLVEIGQMIRRERDFEGVSIDWEVMNDSKAEHYKIFDSMTALYNDLIMFQRTHITPIVERINDDMTAEHGSAGSTPGVADMGVSNPPFASKTFNLVRQLLLSLKVKDVANAAIEELKNGRKPVIALSNTMGAFLADMGVENGDTIGSIDYSITLRRGLDGLFRISETNYRGVTTARRLDINDLTEEGREAYGELVKKINAVSTGITISPIDAIKKLIVDAGYSVGELTGREQEVVIQSDGSAKIMKMAARDKKKLARDFNNGDLDVLIINQSGATGISIHASGGKNKKTGDYIFKDRRQRVMISAQTQLDVNTEIQMRGRTDRTGQLFRSAYRYIISPVPAEQRLIMMFKAKLKSLDANTTSSQKSKTNEIAIVDFLNKYGDEVVTDYLKENRDLNARMLDPLKFGDKSDAEIEELGTVENASSQVSGRVALLPVAEQEKFYTEISDRYTALIQYLDDNNANDLEMTTMPLNATTTDSRVVVSGTGNQSPFSEDSILETVEVDVLKKPMKAAEIKKDIVEILNGKTSQDYRTALIEKLNNYYAAQLAKEEAETRKHYADRLPAILDITAKNAVKKGLNVAQEIEDAKDRFNYAMNSAIEANKAKKAVIKASTTNIMRSFNIGSPYYVPNSVTIGPATTYSYGIFMGFKTKDKMNPSNITAVFATLDGRRKISVPLSKLNYLNAVISQSSGSMMDINLQNWDEHAPTKTRRERHIITGNLLQAYSINAEAQLITYTTSDGKVKQGILLPENYKDDVRQQKVPIKNVIDAIRNGQTITDSTDTITIRKSGNSTYEFSVPVSRVRGGKYFLDKTIRGLVLGGNLNQRGQTMIGTVPERNLEALLDYLSTQYSVSTMLTTPPARGSRAMGAGGTNQNIHAQDYDNKRAQAKTAYEKDLEQALEVLSKAYSEARGNDAALRKLTETTPKTVRGFIKRLLQGTTPESVADSKAALVEIQRMYAKEKAEMRAGVPRERGANFIIEKLSRAARNGDITQEAADLAIDLVRMSPEMFQDLAISITQKNGGNEGSQGWYRSADALVKIFKNPADPTTAAHELLHHTERFMPYDVRVKILEEWQKEVDLQIAHFKGLLKSETDATKRDFYSKAIMYLALAQERSLERNYQNAEDMKSIMLKYLSDHTDSQGKFHQGLGQSFYQVFDASEWWAVNASRLMQEAKNKPELKTWIDKAKAFLNGLIKAAKKIFKGSPTQAVEDGIKAIMEGRMLKNREGGMLADSGRNIESYSNISVGSGVGDKEVKYPEKGEDNVDEVRDSYQPKSNEKSDPTRDYGAEYTQWEKDQLPRYAKTMQAMVDDYIRNYQFLSYDELDNLATAFSDMRKYKYQGVPQSLIDVAHAILVQTGYYKYSNPTVQKGNKEQATRLINETRKQEGIVKTPAQQMADAKAELKRAWNASGLKFDKNAGQNLGFMYDPAVDIKRQGDLFKALYNVAKLAIQQAANKLLAINARDFIASIRGYGKLYADITDAHLTDVFNEAQKAFDAKERGLSLVDPQMSQRTPNRAALAHDLVERVKTIYAKFGVPIAEQKLKKVRGFFQTHPEIVKISSMFNVAVGAHELMHYIIKKHAMVKQALNGSTVVSKQLKDIYINHYPGAKDTHAEELQIEEGMTMLVNLWVQNPAYAQQMYGDAYYAMFDPAGSLYNNDVHDMALDFAEIIEDFLGLPANERIGARIRWGQPGVKKRTLHHNAYNVLKYQIYDKLYLAKDVDRMLGNEFKGSGIAPNIAMMRTAKTRMQHWFVRSRLANTRPQTPGKDGNWKEARYNTTVSDYMDLFHDKKNGLTIEEFNQMLVARRQLSDYKRLDKIDADVAAAKKMIETLEIDNTALEAQIAVETDKAILQSLKVQLSANLQNIQNLISQISELTEDALKTSDILERNRMSRPFAEEVMGLLGQRYAEPARLFDEVQANIVDMMEATGMVSAERANEWRGKDGYASFRRYLDNEEKLRETLVDAVGAKGAKQLTSLFPYKGSDLPLLPATYSQALAINEVMMKGTRNMMWQAWAMAAGNNKDVARMFRQRTSSETDKTDNIVVWMDGKRYFYQASAEVILFANAIENIQPDKVEEVGRAIAKMLQVSVTGIYLPFALVNLSVDAGTRFQLSETGAIPVVHDFRTIYHMLESPVKILVGQILGKEFDPNIIDQYISMGGKASLNINLVNVSAEGVMKQFLAPTLLDKAKLGFDASVEALSLAVNLTELMGRATEYRRAIAQGKPTNVAMMMAQNSAIDWNQRGNFGNTKGGHSLVTKLFNTIAYGFAQVTVFNQLVAGLKRHPVKSTALFTLITAVYAATQYLIYGWGDDDEKREMANQPVEMLPKFIYLPNSILFGPESSGLTKIRIPELMGYMGTHFALGARSAYLGGLKGANTTPKDVAYFSWKTEEQLVAGVLPPMMYPNPFVTKEGQDGRPKYPRMSAFISSLIPTAGKTEVEVINGMKSYPTEMPIIPNYMSTWQAKYQYDKYTTETAKALANAMGWSPKTLDYYITQKTGRGVKMIIEVGEYAFGAKDELDLYNPTQVNDRFFFSGELSNSFYDKANIAINNYKRKKNDLTVTDELATLSKLYEKGMEVLSQTSKATMTKTDKQIDALQLYLDKMEGSPKLTQEERIILKRGELTQAQKSAVFNVWAASYNDDMVALEKAIEALDALNYTDPLFDQKYETQHYINASPEAIEKQ